MGAAPPPGIMSLVLLGGIVFALIPVWLGLWLTWCEKERKGLKEFLMVWTRNWFLTSSIFILFFGGVPAAVSFLASRSLESVYFIGSLALLGYGVWWVAGAIGTLFIWCFSTSGKTED